MSPIHLTKKAILEIENLLKAYKDESGLEALVELSIRHRGCSGLAYNMEFVLHPAEKDYKIQDLPLVLKADSLMWIMGTFVDFEDNGVNAGFVFTNPHQKRSCHCGEAFYL